MPLYRRFVGTALTVTSRNAERNVEAAREEGVAGLSGDLARILVRSVEEILSSKPLARMLALGSARVARRVQQQLAAHRGSSWGRAIRREERATSVVTRR